MPRQKTTPKARKRTPTRSTSVDHMAVALIGYIQSGGNIEHVEEAQANARAILAGVEAEMRGDPTEEVVDPDIMHGCKHGPGVFDTVCGMTLKDYQENRSGMDWSEHVQFMMEMEGDKVKDLSITDPQVAFDCMVSVVTDAAVLGAALMYELMTRRVQR